MKPEKTATLQAYESFNKLSLFIFLAAFLVVGYDAWLVSRAQQPSVRVAVEATGFVPKTVELDVGQSLVWTNQDKSPHWIASDPYPQNNRLPALNSSGPLQTGTSYSYTFDHTGTYTYHDNLHPNLLKGTVIVR